MIAAVLLATVVASAPLELAPGTRYDPRIPTLQSVAGHDFGVEISTPDQIVAYLRALAAAAPERTRLVEYARTWEGRPLHTMVIGAPERMARLDAVKARKAFLIHQPTGEGHIVAFAEEPNFRGYTEATELLFMNAVLLGPAH